jgi:hypothetical protein
MSSNETPRNSKEQISDVESDFSAFLGLVHHHYRPNNPNTTIDFYKQLSSAMAYGTISYIAGEARSLVFSGGFSNVSETPKARWYHFNLIPEVGIRYRTVTTWVEKDELVEVCSPEQKPSDELLTTVKQAILSADDVYLAWTCEHVGSKEPPQKMRRGKVASTLKDLVMGTSVVRMMKRSRNSGSK